MNLRALTLVLATLAVPACKKQEAVAPAADKAAADKASADKAAADKAAADKASADKAAATAELKLTYVAVAVGEKWTKTEDMKTTISIEPQPGKKMDMVQQQHSEESVEVLEIDGGKEKKVKVAYGAVSEAQDMGGKKREKSPPYAGKTYVVSREGDQVVVKLEDGKDAPAEEAAAVGKDQRSVGRENDDAMEKVLSSKTFKPGVKVEFTPDDLKLLASSMGGDDGEPVPVAMSFTLKSVEGDVATFDMTMDMSVERPDGKMKMTLTGTAKVDVKSSRPLELTAQGPLEGNMKGTAMSGSMEVKTVYKR